MAYIVAEVGINHNGNIEIAKELIDIAAEAGCRAVKFQKRTIEHVYTEEELDTPRESPWGKTNRDQKEGLEFHITEMADLEAYAKTRSLEFIISCWDVVSVYEVDAHLDVDYHKLASALLTDVKLLDAINDTGKPVVLSTGMSTMDEIDEAVERLDNVTDILACTSTYPTKPSQVNLSFITTLKKRYPRKFIGFSNHYSGGLACYGAAVLGASMIEFHVTKDRTMYGSDQAASIEHVGVVANGIKSIEMMVGDGQKVVYEDEKPILKKLRRV